MPITHLLRESCRRAPSRHEGAKAAVARCSRSIVCAAFAASCRCCCGARLLWAQEDAFDKMQGPPSPDVLPNAGPLGRQLSSFVVADKPRKKQLKRKLSFDAFASTIDAMASQEPRQVNNAARPSTPQGHAAGNEDDLPMCP